MPWALIEVRRVCSLEEQGAMINAVHAALATAFQIPAEDKHVRLQVHESHRFAHPPTLERPAYATLVSIDCFAGRSVEAKRKLYKEIVDGSNPWEYLAITYRSRSGRERLRTGGSVAAKLPATLTSDSPSVFDRAALVVRRGKPSVA